MAYRKASDLEVQVENWAKEYNTDFYNKIVSNRDFFIQILNIEREKDNPRKDYAKYSDIYPIISFFYDDVYNSIDKNTLDWTIMKSKGELRDVDKSIVKALLKEYIETYNVDVDEETWFNNLKDLASKYNFTSDRKAYKTNPMDFNGQVGDAAGFLRLCLAGRKNTPNIYYVQKILGKDKVFARINSIIEKF